MAKITDFFSKKIGTQTAKTPSTSQAGLTTTKDGFTITYLDSERSLKVEKRGEKSTIKNVKSGDIKPELPDPALECSLCFYVAKHPANLKNHLLTHSDERSHVCVVCAKAYKTKSVLKTHMLIHSGEKRFECAICGQKFTLKGDCLNHQRSMHTNEKPHKCPHCDFCCTRSSHLKRHIRRHTGEKPYQCSECSYAAADSVTLKRHSLMHTGEKPFACQFCQISFRQIMQKTKHEKICLMYQQISCENCPRKFSSNVDKTLHFKKRHTTDTPLKCLKCSNEFTDPYQYREHRKSHANTYFCDLCRQSFSLLSDIRRHVLTHTERTLPYAQKLRKSFKCQHCQKKFSKDNLLKRHEIIHHQDHFPSTDKSYQCSDCDKSFRHVGNLLDHVKAHELGSLKQLKEECESNEEVLCPED